MSLIIDTVALGPYSQSSDICYKKNCIKIGTRCSLFNLNSSTIQFLSHGLIIENFGDKLIDIIFVHHLHSKTIKMRKRCNTSVSGFEHALLLMQRGAFTP